MYVLAKASSKLPNSQTGWSVGSWQLTAGQLMVRHGLFSMGAAKETSTVRSH
jgi:hypothetical protein